MRRGLGVDVDQLEVAERVAVAQLDVTDAVVEVGEHRKGLRLDDRDLDVVAGEGPDRVERLPARDDDDLRPAAVLLDALDGRVHEAVARLEPRSHGALEVLDVGARVRRTAGPAPPAARDHAAAIAVIEPTRTPMSSHASPPSSLRRICPSDIPASRAPSVVASA